MPTPQPKPVTKYPSEVWRDRGGTEHVIALLMQRFGFTREQMVAEMDKHGY